MKNKSLKLMGSLSALLLVSMLVAPASAVSVSMEDIMSVVGQIIGYVVVIGVAIVALIVLLIIAGIINKKAAGLIRWSSVVACLLVIGITANAVVLGPMYNTISAALAEAGELTQESVDNSRAVIEEVAGEGIVLAKNDDNLLPLTDTTNLNVFGWASTNPIYGGTGSGAVDVSTAVDLLQGLTDAGFTLNDELSNFYTEYLDTRPTVGMWQQDWTLPEPAASLYTDEMMSNATSFSDVAVIVIARSGGEGADLPTDMTAVVDGSWAAQGSTYLAGTYDDDLNEGADWDDGDTYLNLTNQEEALVELVCSNFDNVVVIYNGSNTLEMGWTEEYEQIKSVILCPGAGTTGFAALGDILKGNVNPSGKTADTWVADLTATPSFNNFGNFRYNNTEELAATISEADASFDGYTSFVNYVEGIYVGYKYYETADDEGVIDYDAAVVYPFGYGLSYTSFTQEMGPISVTEDGQITFDVVVTNTGTVAGKDVVQVYYNPPYTNGGIEKSSVNLVAFDKTGVIEPNASETISISFSVEDMASYDYQGAGCYVLEAGDYVISINSDSHNVIDSQTYTVDSTITYDEGNARSSDATAATNQFDFAASDSYTVLSRADGFANYDEATAAPSEEAYTLSDELLQTLMGNGVYDPTVYNNEDDVMPTTGADNGVQLMELRGLEYDDPMWDTLLDELTISDMQDLIGYGGFQTSEITSIGKIATMDADGPAGVNSFFTGTYGTGYCAAVMIAQTWNVDLAYAVGDGIARECIDFGISGWYGPAMNMHRSAFAGRNFEYYSEDAVLSGYIGAYEVEGACDLGVYPYLKHFATNDQETNRCAMLCTWMDEQTLREIYLKPFEMTVKANAGSALAVMTAFNFIGTEPVQSCATMLNTVLRGEWGFVGFALTDYFSGYGYQDADRMIRGGNDCMLATTGGTAIVDDTTSATSVIAMRTACKNILYTVVNSVAYDGYTGSTMATWQILLYVGDGIVVVVLALIEILAIRSYRKKQGAGK